MSVDTSFDELMARLRTGEDEAAREVFVRFARRLVGLARHHMDARLAAKSDPEDVVQSAYKSFFVRHQRGDLEVGTWDGLWGVLTLITLRKCADRAAAFRTGKRDVTRELASGGTSEDTAAVTSLALDRFPAPHEAVLLAETVETLFRQAEDPDERDILELSLQGFSAPEIAEKLGRAERSVQRVRERVRKRLERMRLAD